MVRAGAASHVVWRAISDVAVIGCLINVAHITDKAVDVEMEYNQHLYGSNMVCSPPDGS